MNLKARTFERLAFIYLGFGRGAHIGKTSLLEVIYTPQASTLGVLIFLFGTLQAPGSHPNPRSLEEDAAFFTMLSEDSEKVLRHNNACVRDVLTAPSDVYLNLGLNLFHAYF